jgi:hypothetical protein
VNTASGKGSPVLMAFAVASERTIKIIEDIVKNKELNTSQPFCSPIRGSFSPL